MKKFGKRRSIVEAIETVFNFITFGLFDELLPCRMETSIGDAVQAILDSCLFQSGKQELIRLLKRNQSEDYYEAVIKIVESTTFLSGKIELMKALNEKY